MNERVQEAQDFAVLAHEGQVDKAGEPYYLHVLRVSAAGKTATEQIVGALHDVIEDTHYTHADLALLFGQAIADAVQTLSRKGETYTEFIARCGSIPLTRAVKANDILDNIERLHNLPASVALSLRTRYEAALKQLKVRYMP